MKLSEKLESKIEKLVDTVQKMSDIGVQLSQMSLEQEKVRLEKMKSGEDEDGYSRHHSKADKLFEQLSKAKRALSELEGEDRYSYSSKDEEKEEKDELTLALIDAQKKIIRKLQVELLKEIG